LDFGAELRCDTGNIAEFVHWVFTAAENNANRKGQKNPEENASYLLVFEAVRFWILLALAGYEGIS
jgi:hypothetical protein